MIMPHTNRKLHGKPWRTCRFVRAEVGLPMHYVLIGSQRHTSKYHKPFGMLRPTEKSEILLPGTSFTPFLAIVRNGGQWKIEFEGNEDWTGKSQWHCRLVLVLQTLTLKRKTRSWKTYNRSILHILVVLLKLERSAELYWLEVVDVELETEAEEDMMIVFVVVVVVKLLVL